MKFKFAIPPSLAAVCLSLTILSTLHADTYTESGDAGDLPAMAQVVTGTAGTPLTSITGTITPTNAISDSDMFEIFISSPSTFSASTTAFVSGANNFDTQLMIFSATGFGVLDNDDAASGGSQSAISAGSFPGVAGLYYVDISGSGRYATSATGLIFPNYTDGTTDPTGTYGPSGAGGGSAISGYTGSSNEAGKYVIALSGAQFVPAVPEGRTYGYIAAGLLGLVFVTRRRRSISR